MDYEQVLKTAAQVAEIMNKPFEEVHPWKGDDLMECPVSWQGGCGKRFTVATADYDESGEVSCPHCGWWFVVMHEHEFCPALDPRYGVCACGAVKSVTAE